MEDEIIDCKYCGSRMAVRINRKKIHKYIPNSKCYQCMDCDTSFLRIDWLKKQVRLGGRKAPICKSCFGADLKKTDFTSNSGTIFFAYWRCNDCTKIMYDWNVEFIMRLTFRVLLFVGLLAILLYTDIIFWILKVVFEILRI